MHARSPHPARVSEAFRTLRGILFAVIVSQSACSDAPAGHAALYTDGCSIDMSAPIDSLVLGNLHDGPGDASAVAVQSSGAVYFTESFAPNVWRWQPGSTPPLLRVGRPGDGPGEYRRLGAVRVVAGDSILVIDHDRRAVSLLTPEGEFVRRMATGAGLGFHDVAGVFGDGVLGVVEYRSVSMRGKAGIATDSVDVFLWNGAEQQRIATLPGAQRYWDLTQRFDVLGVAFSPSARIVGLGEEIVLAHGGSADLELLAPATGTRRVITLPDTRKAVTPAMEAEHRSRILSNSRAAQRPHVLRLLDLAGTWSDSTPYFDRIITDGERRLALELFRASESAERDYLVVNPAEGGLQNLTLPADVRLMALGRRHAVGLREDDLGGQTILLSLNRCE
jgi:hypothetical protein